MAATQNAMYQLQPGSALSTAFPQVVAEPQNLDLIQIVGQGDALLAKVTSTGLVVGGLSGTALVLTQAAVNSFVATSVVAATGVYTGVFTGGAANAFVGKTVVFSGFVNSGNNVSGVITASSGTTITIAITTQVNESGATAAALVVGVTQVTFTGSITGGGSNLLAGRSVAVAGFAAASGGNNGTFSVISSNGTTLVALASATSLNETHAGTATLAGVTGTNGTRVGVFYTNLPATASIAALFASAFSNPSQQDILQIINLGGNVSYYLNYQGVATGS
jgi:hypothetical protein